jgi:hypothetical protein
MGLFQFATQVIEETLATLFSGLRYRSYMLAERDKVSGEGVWLQLGHQSAPTFSELFKKNWFEEISPGNSLHSLFPNKRCPIFISHSWSDGTEAFVRLLRHHLQEESFASVCLDSAFFNQSACAVQNAFQSGLCEAGVVIVCLTPRYVTRPNCLKEFQWALDLSAKRRISVVFLPLHPALTYDGIKSMLKHKVVYVSAKDDASCELLPLSELASVLLNRYLLEHIGAKNWTEMKAWLSDGLSEESVDSALAAEVRQLVSKPDVRDFLYVECRADENEALCKDMNGELKELNSIVGFSKQVISHDHSLCFSPGIYPEESAARFFWSFPDKLELHEAGVFASWRVVFVTVLPHVAANAKSLDDVSFQVQCQSISADAELKLLLSDSPPCEDPKSRDTVLLSAILLPVGTHIRKVRVEASKRERWLFVLQKLSIHRVVQVQPKTTTISPVTSAAACDLYISTCRRSSVSVGRDMKLYFSAIMDSLVRVFDPQVNGTGVKITFQFGNFMAESSESVAANAAVRMFLVTDDLASAFLGDKKRCECDGCQEIFRCVDGTSLASKTRLVVMRLSHLAQLQSIKHIFDGIVEDVFFVNDRAIECVPREAYLEGSELDAQSERLLAEFRKLFKQPVPVAPLASLAVIQDADLIPDLNLAPQRGSFGEVFKCDWRGTPVAVKKFLRVADRHKFVQEAQMMHKIQHPNCVRLYGVCEAPDSALVMEWMGGGDLSQFLAQRPLPQIHRRLSLFRQICAGLSSLHSHSPDPIIHSDLKPQNILLDSDQKVAKIADFGLSKMQMGSYSGTSVFGTILYFAPEVLLNEVSSHRPTDVYAMGLMLWEMLAGKLVWHNPDGSPLKPVQLLIKYNRHERPSLDELPAGIDPAVIALMQDCWAQDPDQRPTAHELWRRMSVIPTTLSTTSR